MQYTDEEIEQIKHHNYLLGIAVGWEQAADMLLDCATAETSEPVTTAQRRWCVGLRGQRGRHVPNAVRTWRITIERTR